MSRSGAKSAETYERQAEDWYVEPEWCAELLLAAVEFTGPIYDPAMGGGNILNVCDRHKYMCFGSDVIDRGSSKFRGVRDFCNLDWPNIDKMVANIVTNPPYKLAQQFIERAFAIADEKVAVLVQLGFLASQKRKRELFDVRPPTRTLILSRRPSMPPGSQYDPEKEARGGTVDYCWLVWDLTTDERFPVEWLA